MTIYDPRLSPEFPGAKVVPRFSACKNACGFPSATWFGKCFKKILSESKFQEKWLSSKVGHANKTFAGPCSRHTFQITHFANLSANIMEASFTEQAQIHRDFILMASHIFVQAKMYKPTI